MRIAFLARDLTDNSLGRVYCLWLLARGLGWPTGVFAVNGDEIWKPLAGSDFAGNCILSSPDDLEASVAAFAPDLLIAGKPFPDSLGRAVEIGERLGVPVVLDNDDPDIEVGLSWSKPHRRLAREVFNRQRVRRYRRMRTLARRVPNIVSNPVLQKSWGGEIIPHVRLDPGPPQPYEDRDEISVVFVGTNRTHKGVPELRQAIEDLRDRGFRLTVTAPKPHDAKPWERWLGYTTLAEGQALVANADIAVIPSRRSVVSIAQLPAKLMDAMVAGRAVVATDLPPIRWAAAGTALLSKPGSVDGLRESLAELADVELRRKLGAAARTVALAQFTVDAHLDTFRRVCESAVREAS